MSSFGTVFRVTTFGESHCKGVGCIVDGIPPGLELSEEDIQPQLTRRRPGQSQFSTPRDEKDKVQILSGTEFGVTLGTPVGLLVLNEDQRPRDYKSMDDMPRPSHADYTYVQKYGLKASSGGGRSSARETIGRVAAAGIAEKYLKVAFGVEIVAFVSSVGPVEISKQKLHEILPTVSRQIVDQDAIRCPDTETSSKMQHLILDAKNNMDSIGGTVSCVIRNVPTGLGEPVFDKLEAKLAHAMLSIPATKGFEIGSGFEGTKCHGSEHNDAFVLKTDAKGQKRLGTKTNNSGGVQGGISNGENIYFRVAFKPPATISQAQNSTTYEGQDGILEAKGRHDPCVVNRAVSIVEAMAALVLMDAVCIQMSRGGVASLLPHISQLTATEDNIAEGRKRLAVNSSGKPAHPWTR
ncbi:hypothetical protein MP638_005048 [Amoeboaphelidium occidentale]|nr:hypothetical protein MP638_005048 [Amoeboaphelidium occidentale]